MMKHFTEINAEKEYHEMLRDAKSWAQTQIAAGHASTEMILDTLLSIVSDMTTDLTLGHSADFSEAADGMLRRKLDWAQHA